MRLWPAALAVFCFSTNILSTSAKISRRSLSDVATVFGHAAYNNNRVRRKADVILNHAAYVDRRQDTSGNPPAAASVRSSAVVAASTDSTSTDAMPTSTGTDSACIQALGSLNGQSSNPSGMAICYNVLSFDNTTGSFQSTLGLYQVSQATGEWASVNKSSINVGLTYPGATVSTSDNPVMKRDEMVSWPPVRRSLKILRRDSPVLLSDMKFTGLVDDGMGAYTNATAMMMAVMPDVTLSATAQDGTTLDAMLDNTQASFITGVFSNTKSAVASPSPIPTSSASPATASTTAPAVPSGLPGVNLGIFPVGLIVTGTWAILFFLVIGLGTIGRINVRSTYRLRAKDLYPLDKLGKS
ncbi:hypothetical protein MMC26_001528 [Xylographa opegraphella]|nr:hypothetical protein [Xylographa opegraphella]